MKSAPANRFLPPAGEALIGSRYLKGLEYAALPAGAGWLDASTRGTVFTDSGTLAGGVGKSGRKVQHNSSAYSTTPKAIQWGSTWLVVAEGTTTGAFGIAGSGDTSVDNRRIQIDINNGAPRSIAVNTAGTAAVATSTARAVVDGEPFSFVATIGPTGIPKVFFRGVVNSAAAPGGTQGTYTASRIGAVSKLATIAPFNRGIFLVAAWKYAFNESAALYLADHPESLFRTPRIWVPVTAAGSTFKSAWARGCNTVISSGARP